MKLAATSPRRKWLRRLKFSLATLVAPPLLVTLGVPLALSLRPAPKTMRALPDIFLPGHGLAAFADFLTISGGTLYVGYTSQNKMVAIDFQTGRVSATIEGLAGIHGFVPDVADHLGFSSNGDENTVSITDLRTNRVLAKVPTGAHPDAILFDEKAHLVYVANHAGKSATLIDPLTRKAVATIPLGGVAEFAQEDPATGLVYQNLEDLNEVVVVDPTKRAVKARFATAPGDGPTGLALDQKNQRIFVVCGNNRLVVLDQKDGHLVASLPIGSKVDGVGYDPILGRIYTSNAFATMTVIQQDSADNYRVLENAPTPFGGHTLAVDPATHRVYVISPGVGACRVSVFEPIR